MKISTSRLKRIIHEELFHREFRRTTKELTEVESEKQRRYMCAMKDSADRPEGLSKAEAEEMCTGPMKEDTIDSRTRDRALDSLKLSHDAREAAKKRGKRGKGEPDPQFSNLRRLDQREKQPSDPDEVGLDTLEMTEKEYEQWRARGFFDKDKF